jgi:hypothetical protein
MIRKLIILAVLMFFLIASYSQQDSIKIDNLKKNRSSCSTVSNQDSIKLDKLKRDRYVIGLLPSTATNIYGIAFGLFGSDALCQSPYTKYSHGINIQIFGQGFVNTFYINKVEFSNVFLQETYNDSLIINDSTWRRAVHNGILLSTFGTWTDKVNGIAFSLWMSAGTKVNGISFNLLWNLYHQINGVSIGAYNRAAITRGVQIGLMNKTKELRGFQFGLWNKNEKRSLPVINWNFKD